MSEKKESVSWELYQRVKYLEEQVKISPDCEKQFKECFEKIKSLEVEIAKLKPKKLFALSFERGFGEKKATEIYEKIMGTTPLISKQSSDNHNLILQDEKLLVGIDKLEQFKMTLFYK